MQSDLKPGVEDKSKISHSFVFHCLVSGPHSLVAVLPLNLLTMIPISSCEGTHNSL